MKTHKRITRANGAVQVWVTRDRLDGLTVELVSKKLRREWSQLAHDDGATIREGHYIKLSQHIEEFLADVSPLAARNIRATRYPVRCCIPGELAMCIFCVAY